MTKDTLMSRKRTARTLIAASLSTLPVIAIVWSLLAWGSNLPAELPSQWSGDDVVSHQPTFLFATVAVLTAGTSAGFAWHAALRPDGYDRRRRVFLISGSVAAITSAAWLISATLARTSDQALGAAAGLLAIISLFYGLIPFAFAPNGVQDEQADVTSEIAVKAVNNPVWSRTQTVPIFAWATVLCVLASAAFGYLAMVSSGTEISNLSAAIVTVVLAAMFYTLARIRVSVDGRGLRARSATVGILLVAARTSDVASARAVVLEPLRWGGWGLRFRPNGKSLVLRGGPAIVVTMRSGAEVAVTTPDAEQAVAALRALKEAGSAE